MAYKSDEINDEINDEMFLPPPVNPFAEESEEAAAQRRQEYANKYIVNGKWYIVFGPEGEETLWTIPNPQLCVPFGFPLLKDVSEYLDFLCDGKSMHKELLTVQNLYAEYALVDDDEESWCPVKAVLAFEHNMPELKNTYLMGAAKHEQEIGDPESEAFNRYHAEHYPETVKETGGVTCSLAQVRNQLKHLSRKKVFESILGVNPADN